MTISVNAEHADATARGALLDELLRLMDSRLERLEALTVVAADLADKARSIAASLTDATALAVQLDAERQRENV